MYEIVATFARGKYGHMSYNYTKLNAGDEDS